MDFLTFLLNFLAADFLTDLLDSITDNLIYAEAILPSLLKGTVMTVRVFFWTLIFSIPLGLPLALGSESRWWPVRMFCRFYVFVFRGTPLMLQLFFVYFIIPIYTGLMIDAVTSALITFVLNYAAYLSEIYRGGIKSIERGQYETAACLGLSRSQTILGIVLPQMVRIVLPAVSNEMITLVKDTSLVYALGVTELLKASRAAVNRDGKLMAYLLAAVIYLILTFVMTKLQNYLEKRFSKHEQRSE